ncbi:hypothetical protein MAGR_39970 [Mycolicibacterium agri]|uniref:Uncharacterized protein n=2 Tax=Mycolicibacterium agri TaxID=36811 RepID=A0A7I9W5U6_MYCAG|nr:hypothetical protein MAGR_39970 [Mycolicibacterium agri]
MSRLVGAGDVGDVGAGSVVVVNVVVVVGVATVVLPEVKGVVGSL